MDYGHVEESWGLKAKQPMQTDLLRARSTDGLLLLIGAIAAVLLVSRPFVFPEAGLDPSWKYAAEYAYRKGLTFGRDFSFTAGPLSFVYTRLFHPDTFPWIVFSFGHAISVYLAVVWWSENRWAAAACLAVLALLLSPMTSDAIFFSLALIIFLMAIGGQVPTLVIVALTMGLAVPSLAKFNILVLSIVLMLLADVTSVVCRVRPHGVSLMYCLSLIALYLVSGQPIDAFSDFFQGSLDVALGYGQAMGNYWWGAHQTWIVIVSLATLGAAAAIVRKNGDWRLSVAYLMGLGVFLFLGFKTGNVRNGHQQTTWHGLAIVSSTFFMAPALPRSKLRFAAMIGGACTLACFLAMQFYIGGPGVISQVGVRATILGEQAKSAVGWLSPIKRFEDLKNRRKSAEAELAGHAPPNLIGTVGSVPWDIAELIAADYRFVPQPSLQQYQSYTPRLRALDQQHFAGKRRPDHLLFGLTAIDGHYRTTEFGPSLPYILAGYDLVGLGGTIEGGRLLLRRRDVPRPVDVHILDEKSVPLGEWVNVPRLNEGGLMLSIRPNERVIGKLLGLLYKQPHFDLVLKFANGTEVTSRVNPIHISDQFLVLSPDIEDARLFAETEQAFDLSSRNPLVAIRLDPLKRTKMVFSPTYMLSAMSLSVVGAAEHLRSTEAVMLRLRKGHVLEAPEVRMIGNRLLVHTPSKISANILGNRELSGEIGFVDQAWQMGKPDPVMFVISILSRDKAGPIFQRMLDPTNRASDRGPQAFSVQLPSAVSPATDVEVLFETRPGTPWGWTYWSNLKIK